MGLFWTLKHLVAERACDKAKVHLSDTRVPKQVRSGPRSDSSASLSIIVCKRRLLQSQSMWAFVRTPDRVGFAAQSSTIAEDSHLSSTPMWRENHSWRRSVLHVGTCAYVSLECCRTVAAKHLKPVQHSSCVIASSSFPRFI